MRNQKKKNQPTNQRSRTDRSPKRNGSDPWSLQSKHCNGKNPFRRPSFCRHDLCTTEAKSAVCVALAFDQNLIDPYFKKEGIKSLEINTVRTTILADGITLEIANFLQQSGYKAVPQAANFVYRRDTEDWLLNMHPPISHRYLAVSSGIGHFGYSGNIITKEYGSAIVLVSVVTDAELIPTDSLPEEENYCDECKLCLSLCLSEYVDPVEKVTVIIGGKKFSYGKRRDNSRCLLVCMGLTGLDASGKWSTWSPGRFKIPKKMKISFLQCLLLCKRI